VVTAGFGKHFDLNISHYGTSIDELCQMVSEDFRPDLILIHDNSGPIAFTGIPESRIPSIFYSVDAHHHWHFHGLLAASFNHVYVAQKDYIDQMKEVCPEGSIEWLPLWAPIYIEPSRDKKYQACFVGNMDPKLHPERGKFFKELKKQASIEVFEGSYSKYFPFSQCVVNQTVREDLNFRVFEAMMCGTLLLTEKTGNGLLELFEDGVDLVTYQRANPQDAAEKINSFVKNPLQTIRIATTGREKVLQNHLPQHRAKKIFEKIQAIIGQPKTATYLPWMINFAMIGSGFDDSYPEGALVAWRHSLNYAKLAIENGEPFDQESCLYLLRTVCRFDMLTGKNHGETVIRELHQSFPEERLLTLYLVRSHLNRGEQAQALQLANKIAPQSEDVIFSAAEKFVAEILDAKGPS